MTHFAFSLVRARAQALRRSAPANTLSVSGGFARARAHPPIPPRGVRSSDAPGFRSCARALERSAQAKVRVEQQPRSRRTSQQRSVRSCNQCDRVRRTTAHDRAGPRQRASAMRARHGSFQQILCHEARGNSSKTRETSNDAPLSGFSDWRAVGRITT